MNTRALIINGYIKFNDQLRIWVITQQGLKASSEGTIDDNTVVRVCRELNDHVDVMYNHDAWVSPGIAGPFD